MPRCSEPNRHHSLETQGGETDRQTTDSINCCQIAASRAIKRHRLEADHFCQSKPRSDEGQPKMPQLQQQTKFCQQNYYLIHMVVGLNCFLLFQYGSLAAWQTNKQLVSLQTSECSCKIQSTKIRGKLSSTKYAKIPMPVNYFTSSNLSNNNTAAHAKRKG